MLSNSVLQGLSAQPSIKQQEQILQSTKKKKKKISPQSLKKTNHQIKQTIEVTKQKLKKQSWCCPNKLITKVTKQTKPPNKNHQRNITKQKDQINLKRPPNKRAVTKQNKSQKGSH